MASPTEKSTPNTTIASGDFKAHRLSELREFLMSRRARVTPTEAGLPDGGARRRTPGLRREEVAVLAGVGVSWYQWLEQGRDITVSPQVLDSVARVLKLSSIERRHLYVLAGLNPPAPETDPVNADMCVGLQRLIDTWMPFPAHIMDVYWNTIMYNGAAALVLGMRPDSVQNCLIAFFTDPVYRSRAQSWGQNAAVVVAQYRAACSDNPGDEGFREVVAELRAESTEFAELWERRDIQPGGQVRKEFAHPLVGTLCVESTQLRIPARPDLTIVLHTPLPEADTAAKLEWLSSPEGRRGSMYPVAG
ncbi:helix-turn-helix transcriptional regulator [Streptomyces sp. A5-4]|uniref:helix-turn-helix transcriptional regulator n=1 Tax=Streptomyces sp. A5-4 TaxID=3384771 RepID=UPI003DAA451C